MPTHGSLSKAGKMRQVLKLQPIWKTRRDKLFRGKKHKHPRLRLRRKYEKLLSS